MKILILANRFFEGGELTHMLQLSKELVKSGCEVHITTGGLARVFEANAQLNKYVQYFRDEGITVKELPLPDQTSSLLGKMYKMFGTLLPLYRYLRKEKFDIIHVHRPIMSFFPKVLGFKFISTVHNLNLDRVWWDMKANHYIAVSEEVREELLLKRNISPDKITVVHNGVDLSFSVLKEKKEQEEIKRDLGIPKDKIIIGFVGRITYDKGVDLLINAVSDLNTLYSGKLHLVLLGGFWDSREWFEEVIRESGIGDSYSHYDFQGPKPFYDCFDIFCLPARKTSCESFSLVTVEAMMSGVSVVRSDTGGAIAQIESGKEGFIFTSGDVESLKSCLKKMIEDEIFRIGLGTNGRRKAMEKFSSGSMAQNTLNVYQKYLNNNK